MSMGRGTFQVGVVHACIFSAFLAEGKHNTWENRTRALQPCHAAATVYPRVCVQQHLGTQ